MAEDVSVVMHSPNTKNIGLFLMVMSIAMLASKTGDYMNLCIPLFEAKYGWETQAQKDLNESLMNTIPAFGTIFGSGAASSLMVHGRAKAFIISCFIGIGASLFTFIQNFIVFLIAKFIVGISIGMMGVIVARYIEEYVPLKWFGIS